MANEDDPAQPQLSPFQRDFGPSYFDHVLAEYELLSYAGAMPPRLEEIIEKHKSGAPLQLGDLYLLEKYVICKQPEEVVRARLPGLRLSYREIVGPDAYEDYLQSPQAAQPDSDLKQLQADAGRLLDALHWAYIIAPQREAMRSRLLRNIATEMMISVAIGLGAILVSAYLGQLLVTAILLVLLMGALGGFLSVQQRIEKIPTELDPLRTMLQMQSGTFAVGLAPLTGAICALVLFLIFQGGLLTGAAFPDMSKLPLSFGKLRVSPGAALAPNWALEYGKLLVWSFIAGFAERFVPDTLDNLVPKREAAAPAKGAAPVIVATPRVVAGPSAKAAPGAAAASAADASRAA